MADQYPAGAEVPFAFTFANPTNQQPAAPTAKKAYVYAIGAAATQSYSATITSIATGVYGGVFSTGQFSTKLGKFIPYFSAAYSSIGYRQTGDPFTLASSPNASTSGGDVVTLIDEAIAEIQAARSELATAAELAKVPKSDGTSSWNATALAAINAECDTALSDYGANTTTPPTAAAIADAVWDETSAGHTDAGKAGEQLWTDLDAVLADTGELQTNQGNWATATTVDLNADQSGVTIGTVSTLTGHTAQTGDNYARLGAPAGASIAADIAENQTDLDAVLADTNELQTDWANGGRLDTILDTAQTDSTKGRKLLGNKMEINESTGEVVLYDDDSTTPIDSGTPSVTSAAGTTTRTKIL